MGNADSQCELGTLVFGGFDRDTPRATILRVLHDSITAAGCAHLVEDCYTRGRRSSVGFIQSKGANAATLQRTMWTILRKV